MSKESFMMVSLKGDKAKKLAQVMSNPTCMKILEYLAGKESTETQISNELNIPLSTVHYNMQQLAEAKLVLADEFHYSDKGREVTHYKLAKQYIIIAPDDDDPGFLDRLKKFVPVAIITIGLAAVLKTTQFLTATNYADQALMAAPTYGAISNSAAENIADVAADSVVNNAADAVGGAMPAAVGYGADAARSIAAPKMMVATEAFNETINETFNETINETLNQTSSAVAALSNDIANQAAQDAANQAAQESFNQAAYASVNSTPHLPWWQSPMIDYFLLGAVFVLVILVITEAIFYWRAKDKK